jgi:hypothetical protein
VKTFPRVLVVRETSFCLGTLTYTGYWCRLGGGGGGGGCDFCATMRYHEPYHYPRHDIENTIGTVEP